MQAATLIFPNQLFEQHPALDTSRTTILYEEPLIFGSDLHWEISTHKKRLILYRASMQNFQRNLEAQGSHVTYIKSNGYDKIKPFTLLEDHLDTEKLQELHLAKFSDDILERRLTQWAHNSNIKLIWYESPMFLTPLNWGLDTISKTKKPLMASFYQHQRRRLGILVDEKGKPHGGKWSFDADNRKKLPKDQPVPEFYTPQQPSWLNEVIKSIETDFPNSLGVSWGFEYPVTHEAAKEVLQRFLHERFHLFGDYEDAISSKHKHLFHSVLTPALNIGLITPQQVVDQTLQHGIEHKIPLNSLEGFIRQIIGWREFIRLIYHRHGREQRTRNYWGHNRKIPKSFYDGTTGIAPIDHIIHQLHETAYCHHIERLMVLGNFFLLCRFDPDEVYRWFMEFFIDADDWVMVPNVYGMTQFADGGIFSTKPYIAGSNYLKKMSDHPKGEWQEIWDGLFWTFVMDKEEFFRSQPRLGMMTRQLDMRDEQWKNAKREKAHTFWETMT